MQKLAPAVALILAVGLSGCVEERFLYERDVAFDVAEDEYDRPAFTAFDTEEIRIFVWGVDDRPFDGHSFEYWLIESDDHTAWAQAGADGVPTQAVCHTVYDTEDSSHATVTCDELDANLEYVIVVDNSERGEVSPPSNFRNDQLTGVLQLSYYQV